MSAETSHVARRARSFGGVAEAYDRARPGYPEALFAHIAEQLPGRRVLEPQPRARLLAVVGTLIRERFEDRLVNDFSTGCHQARRRP